VQPLVATRRLVWPNARCTAAVAGKVIKDIPDLHRLLVYVHLPGIAEVLALQLGPGRIGRQGAHLQRGGWMISGYPGPAGFDPTAHSCARSQRKLPNPENSGALSDCSSLGSLLEVILRAYLALSVLSVWRGFQKKGRSPTTGNRVKPGRPFARRRRASPLAATQKKTARNGLAVRAGRRSDANYFNLVSGISTAFSTGIYTA